MKGRYVYEYPRPAVTVDVVLFGLEPTGLKVLLIRRKGEPFAGQLALPGGFLEMDEAPEDGARRELEEETGIDLASWPMQELGFFGRPGRDPRGRTISLVYYTFFPPQFMSEGVEPRGSDDATEAAWVPMDEARGLAFDHDLILARARERLSADLDDAVGGDPYAG